MKADAQALKGHLDTLLLASLENGPQHGYAVKQALRTGSGAQFDLPTGTIYPALRRLAAAGLVTGTWSQRRPQPPGLRTHPGRPPAANPRPGRLAGLRRRRQCDPGASTMSSALINDYVAGLHRRLPAGVADEAADGLIETYELHPRRRIR